MIHNGREAFPCPCASLERWRAERGPVILVSNSPRPWPEVAEQLDGLGVPRQGWSVLVTSGDVTRDLLEARAPGPALAIGPERDAGLYSGLGLEFAGPTAAAFIACTGLEDDETQTPEDYRDVLAAAAARGLEMICANPDKVVQRGERLIWCAGALAALYQGMGGTVRMAGKPYAPIYALCLAKAGAALGRGIERRKVLAIGDGVATDIAGANREGLDAVFIAGGIHADEFAAAPRAADPALAQALLARSGAWADYTMRELAW